MPQHRLAKIGSLDALPEQKSDIKDGTEIPIGEKFGSRPQESISDAEIGSIYTAIERKARFLASKLEAAQLNGAMTEDQRNAFEESLTYAIAILNQNFDDCYVRKEIDKEELKKRFATSWGEIKAYLKEVEELEEKKARKKRKKYKPTPLAPKTMVSDKKGEKPESDGSQGDAEASRTLPDEPATEAVGSSASPSDDFPETVPPIRDVDMSGIDKNPWGLSRSRILASQRDMIETAREAAKQEPFFVGKKKRRVATEGASPVGSVAADTVVESQESIAGQKGGEAPIRETQERIDAQPLLLPLLEPKQSETTLEDTPESSATELPSRQDLRKNLSEVLAQLREVSERSAKAEQEALNAKEYWEEAALLRDNYEQKKGLNRWLFFNQEALQNLQKEEAENERHYRKVAARAEELKKQADTLRNRRDELERDLEDMSVNESAGDKGERPETTEGHISEYVISKFESVGIKAEHLQEIHGFPQCSEGQQLLVLENLRQLALGRIQEEAEGKVGEEMRSAGWAGKLWKSVSKQYQIAKAEKAVADDIMKGGMAVHGKVLEQLVGGMRSQGPEVKVGDDGKTLEIGFVSGLKNLSEQNQSTIDAFNKAANVLARMPYEWSLETARESEKKWYADAKQEYDSLRRKMLDVIIDHSLSTGESMVAMNDIEDRVRMMQFLQNHPDLEGKLDDLEDQDAWRAIFSSMITERGIYMASGYAGRTVLAGTLGWIAAPAVATVMGGIAARKRAQDELHAREIAARKGLKDKSTEAKNFVSVSNLSHKLEKSLYKVLESKEEEGHVKAAVSLKTRIEYTRKKLEKGLVDFGAEAHNRVWEQYDLFQLLSRAEAAVGVYSGENKELTERLSRFLTFKDKKIQAAQKRYILNETMKGAAYAAGFSLAGAGVRHLSELVADRIAVPAGESEPLHEVIEASNEFSTAPLSPTSYETVDTSFSAAELESGDVWSKEVPPESGISADTVHGDSPSDQSDAHVVEHPRETVSPAISQDWNEAAKNATLGEELRPEVALSRDTTSLPEENVPETGSRDEGGMNAIMEKLSAAETVSTTEAANNSELVAEAKASLSPEPVQFVDQGAPLRAMESASSSETAIPETGGGNEAGVDTPTEKLSEVEAARPEEPSNVADRVAVVEENTSSIPAEPESLSAFPETGGIAESVADVASEVPEATLGDTRAFIAENPDMLESLKREVGGYRVGIFQTPETDGDINHDYIHSGLGRVSMADALESYEYEKSSDLDTSQLSNLNEFREAVEKTFVAKLGEQEGKGAARVAAGETIDEYTKRVATIALQLGVKVKGF